MNPDAFSGLLVPLLMALVACVIALIAVNLVLLSRLKEMQPQLAVSASAPTDALPVVPAASEIEAIPAHHLAIITAVVSTLVREPHIVLDARALDTPPEWTQSMLHTWAMEGRSAIFSSHKVR